MIPKVIHSFRKKTPIFFYNLHQLNLKCFKEIISFSRNKINYNIWYLVFKCPIILLLSLKSFAKLLEMPLGAGLDLKWHWSGINYCEIFHMQPTYTVFDFETMWLALTSYVCESHRLVYISYVIALSVL